MGISFTFVTVLCGIVATYGYNVAIGAIIVGGILEGILGLFAKYWHRLISPIVAAVVVTSIGFSLLNVGAASFGGGAGAADFGSPRNLLLGSIALVSCLIFQVLRKGQDQAAFGSVRPDCGLCGGNFSAGRRFLGVSESAAFRSSFPHAVRARVQPRRHRFGDRYFPGVCHGNNR